MENTLGNKAKFFAQYFGQNVRIWEPMKDRLCNVGYTALSRDAVQCSYLQLKPLSAISCDEAVEIAKFMGLINARAIRVEDDCVVVKDYSYSLVFDKGVITMHYNGKVWYDDNVRIADKVRDMGFLYEFMDLSREEILNRGWAVLEQEA